MKDKREGYWKRETTQYNVRFTNSTGVPAAIKSAAESTGTTCVEYIKRATVQKLKRDGFIHGEVVLNKKKQLHREKLARLKEYIAQEEQKMK